HLAILLSKEHRPVDLWATRIAELPTSPTGLHYDGFSLSNSTRNDEEPSVLDVSIRSDVAGLWRGYRRGGRGLAVHAGNMAQAWW
ncbi:hypothetical protein, partial [Limnohabitans sp.]|uniref:hypothetical protein n=1 Tax=Limnohabitans sp. TaxID=1907725 RepID=UPI0035AF591D